MLKEKKSASWACSARRALLVHINARTYPFPFAQNFVVTTTESVGPFAASFALKIGQ